MLSNPFNNKILLTFLQYREKIMTAFKIVYELRKVYLQTQ